MSRATKPIYDIDFTTFYKIFSRNRVAHDRIVVLAQVHCVPSTVELFKQIQKRISIHDKNRIIIVPKQYSTILSAIDEMKKVGYRVFDHSVAFKRGQYDDSMDGVLFDACKFAVQKCDEIASAGKMPRLIIIDDGGIITNRWWNYDLFRYDIDVISIQQTQSGIDREPNSGSIVKIDVARSAAKKFFESQIICQGVLRKVKSLGILESSHKIGIIGLGSVGGAIARDLISSKYPVSFFDIASAKNIWGGYRKNDAFEVVRDSDIIFGCTGRNALSAHVDRIFSIEDPKIFISCSSRDVEFLEMLRSGRCCTGTARGEPFAELECGSVGACVHLIENGGFPINFDRETEWEFEEDIALTRGLILAAVLQAIWLPYKPNRGVKVMVAPGVQRRLVERWLSVTLKRPDDFSVTDRDFRSLDWWYNQSGGTWPYELY